MTPFSLSAPASTTTSAAFPCISSGDQTAINSRFSQYGAGHVVQLCQGAVISVTGKVELTAHDQELSTEGYPTGDQRATIKLAPGANTNTTVFAKFLDNIKLRNIIVDGNRAETGYTGGDANIDIGGHGTGQLVDHVASRNPRGWSCLAVGFGGQTSTDTDPPCTNATLTNNDIGPCGIEGTEYADGISFQCTDSTISDNSLRQRRGPRQRHHRQEALQRRHQHRRARLVLRLDRGLRKRRPRDRDRQQILRQHPLRHRHQRLAERTDSKQSRAPLPPSTLPH
ncbi:hypothetical protein MPH_00116 [Macrophomina phaseolina MS6]|uniref:Right handed beta helix domain-containing protein n=1 Tax=Macrophomina phaseolina (strain MS6) TaxID=1126212 RepID=K2S6S1_MACPH|nr:hypothetical protein MPH_00116 [Macrophomina phaseolina MS6]